jgi:hypothetical protein
LILFFDLLYSEHGSFLDDYQTIDASLSGHEHVYVRVNIQDNFWLGKVLGAVAKFKPERIVFLSAKIQQLLIMLPFILGKRIYAIYHFRPNGRKLSHQVILPVLGRFYKFAAYSPGVESYLRSVIREGVSLVTARAIRKEAAAELAKRKVGQDQITVLLPGIRPGVRDYIEPSSMVAKLESVIGKRISKVYVQSSEPRPPHLDSKVEWIAGKMTDEEYKAIYARSLFVGVKFNNDYETRSSAVVTDAIGHGCILITWDHPITRQYGFPKRLVTNVENVQTTVNALSGDKCLESLYQDYQDLNEARTLWIDYLELGERDT